MFGEKTGSTDECLRWSQGDGTDSATSTSSPHRAQDGTETNAVLDLDAHNERIIAYDNTTDVAVVHCIYRVVHKSTPGVVQCAENVHEFERLV